MHSSVPAVLPATKVSSSWTPGLVCPVCGLNSPGWGSAHASFLFLSHLSCGQRSQLYIFFLSYWVTWKSFLQLWLYRSSLPVFSWFSRGIVPHVGIFLMCAWGEVSFMSSNSAILIQCPYEFFSEKKNWCLLYMLISIVNLGIHKADKSLLFVHIWTPVWYFLIPPWTFKSVIWIKYIIQIRLPLWLSW